MTTPEYALNDIRHSQIAMPPEEEGAGLRFKLGQREVHLGEEAAGHRIDEDVQVEGYRRFHVRDPFGNRLELIEPL